MNRDEYLKFHKDFCDKARELSARKNNDYAGEGGAKPFANFERVEAMGICSTQQGFLVRMTDKMSRLATFANGGKLQVLDESALDTLLDIVNYAVLLAAYISQESEPKTKTLRSALEAAATSAFEKQTPSQVKPGALLELPAGVAYSDIATSSAVPGAFRIRRDVARIRGLLRDAGWALVAGYQRTMRPPAEISA